MPASRRSWSMSPASSRPTGKVKVSLYGSDSSRWLAKGGRISKVKVPVTGKAMDICLPVPGAGPLCGRGPS